MADLSLQILLVEDNPTDVLLLREALDYVPHVTFVLTPVQRLEAGLHCLATQRFDAVLLDLGLPDSQGLQTLDKILSHHPDVPIIVLSGSDDEDLAIRAVRNGAQDYLVKGKSNGSMIARVLRYAIERKQSEQRLRASEVSYRRLFETAQDGIFILDADTGQITDVNPYLETLLGYTKTEFLGKRLWEISPFRDRAASQAAFRTLQEKGYIRYGDLPLAAKSGDFIPVEFVSNVYAVGEKHVIQCNIRDITERQQAEALLAASEERLALATESARIGIWDWDVVADNMLWDAQMYALYGIREQDFSGAYYAWQRGLHPEDRDRAEASITAALEGSGDFHDQFRVVWPGGEVHYIEAHGIVQRADDGSPLRMIGVNWDITERKEAEKELRRSLGLLQAVTEGTTEAILLTDRAGRYLMVNRVAAGILGVRPEEAQGKDATAFYDPQMARLIRENDRGVMEAGQAGTFEETGTTGGVTRTFLATRAPYRDAAGQVIGIINISRDITEQKRLQEQMIQSERLAAMGELVAGVAHEINNPLTAISGYAQLLQMHPDGQVREDSKTIQQMTERASRIVRSLLAFSRQGDGVQRLSTPLRSLVEGTLGMVRYKLNKSSVEVVLNLAEPDLSPMVNPGQMEQVLLNLMNNAEHALRKREADRRITISTSRVRQEDGEWAALSVTDNGHGIAEQVRGRIFDPFFTTKPQGEGTGLGLSICHGIVEEHGGRLEVTSQIGVGTTFTLMFPVTV